MQIPTAVASAEVDYECELDVVIGETCKHATVDKAFDFVLGYTCGKGIGARDWQKEKGGQWCRGKTFDTFAPLGPRLITADELGDPNSLKIGTTVNGEVVQD